MRTAFQFSKVALFVHAVSLPLMASADVSADNFSGETLNEIVVSGTPFSQQVGTQKITAEEIKNLPKKNGNVSDILRSNANVRFSNGANSSKTGGEIAPNEVSIHGAQYYSNNYTINGFSNNDNLNPSSNSTGNTMRSSSGYSPDSLPGGGTQSFWLDSSLLKNVEVFDSNIAAKYGNFTGGVINAELIDPDFERASGKISYRTSRSSWADYFITEQDEKAFYNATMFPNQPIWKKQQFSFIQNAPLSDKAALLFSYNKTKSDIVFYHDYDGFEPHQENQRRENETYLLRGVYLPDNGDAWKATIMYSPNEAGYPKKNVKNGYFTQTGGGTLVGLEWEKQFDDVKMTTKLGYKKTGNEISHNATEYKTYRKQTAPSRTVNRTVGDSLNWRSGVTSAAEGGYGTYKTEKTSYTLSQDFDWKSFDWGNVEHKLSFGWNYEYAKAKYQRKNNVYNYTTQRQGYENIPGSDCLYCIPNDQWFTQRIFYPARKVSVNDSSFSAYIQDEINWKRLNAALGLRFDRNKLLGNNNIAPRLSLSYDVFGDQSTRIFAGANRYYAGSILSYELSKGIKTKSTITRSKPTDDFNGLEDTETEIYRSSRVKTPYSDELTFGVSQKLFSTIWTFKYVNRNEKDQYSRTTICEGVIERSGDMKDCSKITRQAQKKILTNVMSNQGRTKTDSFSLQITPEKTYDFGLAKMSFSFGASYEKSKSSTTSYNSTLANIDKNGEMTHEKLIIDGKMYDIDNAPRTDYSKPWRAYLNWITEFPQINLTWAQHFEYESPYKGYRTIHNSIICSSNINGCAGGSERVQVQESYKFGSKFMVDWHFTYTQPIFKNQSLEISLDINNVLNRKTVSNATSATNPTYEMGRNYWLGVSYNW